MEMDIFGLLAGKLIQAGISPLWMAVLGLMGFLKWVSSLLTHAY